MELPYIFLVFISQFIKQGQPNEYYGTYVGDFKNRFHGVSGEVYAVDSRTLFIKDFRFSLWNWILLLKTHICTKLQLKILKS